VKGICIACFIENYVHVDN